MATDTAAEEAIDDTGKADDKGAAEDRSRADGKGNAGKKDKADKKGKADGKGKAGKKGRDAKGTDAAGDGPSLASHPRAARAIARAKAWGGLIGFVLGGYLSLPTDTLAGAGLRALAAGVVGYVAVWAGAVFLWRRLVMLELGGRRQRTRRG